jgi:hypothetical protein
MTADPATPVYARDVVDTVTAGGAAPTTREGSGRLSALIVSAVALVAAFGLARDVTAPTGEIQNAACAWHGQTFVMSGVVINHSRSRREFVVTPAFALAGHPFVRTGSQAVYVAPLGAQAWRWADVSVGSRSGSAITACNPSVALPSSSD